MEPLAESLGKPMLFECDVASDDSIDALFAALKAEWGQLDFLVHAIGFADKNELRGRYVDTSPRRICAGDGHLGLFLHRRLPAGGGDDGAGRQPADADLLRRRKGHAALQRDGRGQGRRWRLRSSIWPRIWARTASA